MKIEEVAEDVNIRNRKATAPAQQPPKKTSPPRSPTDHEGVSFSTLDILRMIMGVVAFNLLVSYWFTGTWTYNYNGKLLQPHYIQFQLFGSPVSLTEDQLSLYNGTDPELPIYIAINGTVWDVSSNKGIYSPGGSYDFFSGKDCARALATNCLNHLTFDIRDITPEERRRLGGWIEWFDDKYFRVGTVYHDEPEELPMSRKNCQGKRHHH